MRDDAVLRRALPLGRGLGRVVLLHNAIILLWNWGGKPMVFKFIFCFYGFLGFNVES